MITFSLSAQSFGSSGLDGESLNNPTSLQFGPDGRLYVSQQNGTIYAYSVVRDGANDYRITNTETINNVKNIQNHDDDGTPNDGEINREVTGLLVVCTAANPVLYVTSSDFHIGGGGGGSDVNLDTNSGMISRLTKNGNSWSKVDLVRGLPRSEENHATNGLQLDASTNILYVAQGGHTNAGSPSNNFAFTTEYALSAAILTIDLDAINSMSVKNDNGSSYIYDLPTLDDPTRPNVNGQDINDPFGGNDGLNQAKIVPGGPVQIYSPGFRNIYDVVLTESGNLYTWDNGANAGWGGHPDNEGGGNATNNWVSGEPGSRGSGPNDPQVNNQDGLHFVTGTNYYGGHPNPIRANPSGAGLFTHDPADGSGGESGVWRTSATNNVNTTLPSDWPPLPLNQANPIEGDFQNAGETDGSIFTVSASTNGMTEYRASNFGGSIKGNLLAASFNGNIYRVDLNNAGSINNNSDVSVLASGFGSSPLDVTAQGDNDPFPGTVWATAYGSDNVVVFEPADYGDTTNPGPEDGNIYINAGGPGVVTDGIAWSADQYFQDDIGTFSTGAGIQGTTSDVIYQSERYGPMSYAMPLANGTYSVELHFAEIYNGTQSPGARVFDVVMEGSTVLNNFDIASEVGFQTASIKTFSVTVNDGILNIGFNAEIENPKISGIAVLGTTAPTCQGNPGQIDEDGDGYTNSDELANGTNPCNGADKPEDFDQTTIGGFLVSNLNDPDDDDDGILDTSDKFAWDANNGQSTSIPIDYPFLNGDPGFGFFGLGFTGLMTNGTTDYLDLIQDENNSASEIIAGGAVGLFSINGVPSGDAIRNTNSQQNAFQFGMNVNSNTNSFAIESGLLGPAFIGTPSKYQSAGIFLGTGDQNNYLKFVVTANNGNPGLEVLYENNGGVVSSGSSISAVSGIASQAEIKLKLAVDPSTGAVQPQYAFGSGSYINFGNSVQLTGATLNALQANNTALAVGVISTTYNSNANFSATWDYLNVAFEISDPLTSATLSAPSNVTVSNGTEIVTVTHTNGTQPIVVQAISINNNNFQFNSFRGTPFTLNQGESFDLEISHTSGANQSGVISIQHDGSNGSTTSINLSSGNDGPTTGCTVNNSQNYETGYGVWNDGGADCDLVNWPGSSTNTSVRLRDNSGAASSVFTDNINFNNASSLDIKFDFYPQSFETGENFFLEYSTNGGSNWSTIRSWVVGSDFTNGLPSSESVSISGPFSAQTSVRFRCDASGNGDIVFIDNVVIEECDSSPVDCSGTITSLSLNPQGGAALIGLSQGQSFCAADFTSDNISIRANVNGDHESLLFSISTPNGNGTNTEDLITYDSYSFAPTPGNYTVTAQLFSESSLGGELCDQFTLSFTIESAASCGNAGGGDCFTEYNSDGFENSYGIWNDGGTDCYRRQNSDDSASGNYHIRLRDNSGVNSSTFTDALPFANVTDIKVDFMYIAESMEAGEDFLLEYSNDGSSWTTVESWISGVDFSDRQFYRESISFSGSFTNDTRIRFRCDASGNLDKIFLDEVYINICGSAGVMTDEPITSANSQVTPTEDMLLGEALNVEDVSNLQDELKSVALRVYPNPVSLDASNQLFVDLSNHMDKTIKFTMLDVAGQKVAESILDTKHAAVETLNLMKMDSGLYLLYIQIEGQELMIEKIIVN